MLRITVHDLPESQTFKLEGRLEGPWVREAVICLRQTTEARRKPVLKFDLTEVTAIDAAGKAFLAEVHAHGAQLVACGCLMRAVVAEITNARISNSNCGNAMASDGRNEVEVPHEI